MIELSQIPNTSKLKELRGQINTMADEINGNQMVVGQVLNPRVIINYSNDNREVDVSLELNQLFALCMPKSNSVYIAQVFGAIYGSATTDNNPNYVTNVSIIIPAVKLPNRTAEVSSFVTPGSLGFTGADSGGYAVLNTGVQVKLQVSNSTDSTTSIITNTMLNSSSTYIILDKQILMVLEEQGPVIVLPATHAPN